VRQVGNIEVFWRPGCPFCMKLRATLALRNVKVRWINIWEDDEARQFVREENGGNETVPTVRIGERVLTNPTWRQFRAARDHQD
jgi:mycoredoxin